MRILLAEDDRISQLLMRRALERHGHVVTVVGNGSEAVETFELSCFDVVLLDIHMPVMDGFQVAREIRRKERLPAAQTPIIACTAIPFSAEFQQAGIGGYCSKPVNLEQLLNRLKEIEEKNASGRSASAGSP